MKSLLKIAILIPLILIVLILAVWIYSLFFVEKKLELISPNGQEVWQASKTYQIRWESRKIGSVGIILVKGTELKEAVKEAKWIAKDIPASRGSYDWQIFIWEETGQDYKIGIFEYPWQEGKKIDYSDGFFTIVGPQFASCDSLSIEKGWPYLPSDFPGQRKVFITRKSFNGNLGGLKGADQKCQEEAAERNFAGTWKAFLGDDENLAIERLKLDGIFVEAEIAAILPEAKTCHRLLGKNFDDFFAKLSDYLILNQLRFEKEFLDGLENLWLGRIDKGSKEDCLLIYGASPPYHYSFTTTCQNWTSGEWRVFGYPPPEGQVIEFPKCYTPEGIRIEAVGLAGLSSGKVKEKETEYFWPSLGKSCSLSQRLLCIEQ